MPLPGAKSPQQARSVSVSQNRPNVLSISSSIAEPRRTPFHDVSFFESASFVESEFKPRLRSTVRSPKLAASRSAVRTTFRVPAAMSAISASEYFAATFNHQLHVRRRHSAQPVPIGENAFGRRAGLPRLLMAYARARGRRGDPWSPMNVMEVDGPEVR
jgi:hypothetical protein